MLSEESSEKYSQTDVCYFERREKPKIQNERMCDKVGDCYFASYYPSPQIFTFCWDTLQDHGCYFASLYPSPMFLHFFGTLLGTGRVISLHYILPRCSHMQSRRILGLICDSCFSPSTITVWLF